MLGYGTESETPASDPFATEDLKGGALVPGA
jgi:hypothetical protein